tara:strand:- start:42 stop:293 length:252 start_codon:yes stop_codon:yes gene_type:complete
MSELSGAMQRLQDLQEELNQLERARDLMYAALYAIEEADTEFNCCTGLGYSSGVSHHASMEIEESLSMVEDRIQEIEGAAEQL